MEAIDSAITKLCRVTFTATPASRTGVPCVGTRRWTSFRTWRHNGRALEMERAMNTRFPLPVVIFALSIGLALHSVTMAQPVSAPVMPPKDNFMRLVKAVGNATISNGGPKSLVTDNGEISVGATIRTDP